MIFTKLELSHINLLKPYLAPKAARTCDFTPGTVFMWRNCFNTYFSIYNNTLILKNTYNGFEYYNMPVGENIKSALKLLYEECKNANTAMYLSYVPENNLELIDSIFNTEISESRDWFDYIYSISNLATFAGHKYNGQRNHINYFNNNHNSIKISEIKNTDTERLKQFMQLYEKNTQKSSDFFTQEMATVYDVLNNFDMYGQNGIFIEADGEIVSFCMGEVINDTQYVHIEKALASERGAYQTTVREFAKYTLDKHPDVLYINREEDMGDEGLRKSKLSYHPLNILPKYTIKIKSLK